MLEDQLHLCVKSEEDDNWDLPGGFGPLAKNFLQTELRSVRPLMTKMQQELFIKRLETSLSDDQEWNNLPKATRLDNLHAIKQMPPHPHKILPCSIEFGQHDKYRFSATVDGVLQFTATCFLKLRTRSEIHDSLFPDMEFWTEWRKLNALEMFQLAYIRYRPIMASTILCRLLLAVGTLCLNPEDLQKLLCSKVMREGLLSAATSDAPTDNALMIPYYGLLRKCSVNESVWNEIVPFTWRRHLWSEDSEPRRLHRDDDRRLAFREFDKCFDCAESSTPALDALVLNSAMANWIFAGDPPRQYPFSMGLRMVNNEILPPFEDDSTKQVMTLVSRDNFDDPPRIHRISTESQAYRTQELALLDSARRNEKLLLSKERRRQQGLRKKRQCHARNKNKETGNMDLSDIEDENIRADIFNVNNDLFNSSVFTDENSSSSEESLRHHDENTTGHCSADSDVICLGEIESSHNRNMTDRTSTPNGIDQERAEDPEFMKNYHHIGDVHVDISLHSVENLVDQKRLKMKSPKTKNVENDIRKRGKKSRIFRQENYRSSAYLETLSDKVWLDDVRKDFGHLSSPEIPQYSANNARHRRKLHTSGEHFSDKSVWSQAERSTPQSEYRPRSRIMSNGFYRATQSKTKSSKFGNICKIVCKYGIIIAACLVCVVFLFHFISDNYLHENDGPYRYHFFEPYIQEEDIV
ncbi:hypothetical protein DdX_03716 [Ditylenchus destructor]|uniref:Uncharacterized protein n=1 Tax=Ditylenchus destructor TaxID=166010 RepID=A0AAD4NAL6_9BILA|nr:hypothetical protein DdX_03716 [Ditylenchus destructor]